MKRWFNLIVKGMETWRWVLSTFFVCSFLIELLMRIDREVGGDLAYTLPRDVRYGYYW